MLKHNVKVLHHNNRCSGASFQIATLMFCQWMMRMILHNIAAHRTLRIYCYVLKQGVSEYIWFGFVKQNLTCWYKSVMFEL